MSLIPNGRPFYYPLYPEIAPCEENEELECELLGKKKEELSGSNNNNMNEEDNSVDVLTSIFETQKEKKKRTKTQKNAIFDFLLKSELIEKIKKELNAKNPNEVNIDEKINYIIKACAETLTFQTVPKGNLLFRYKDIGDKCYFLIKGRLSILKPQELEILMTYDEYIRYLIELDRLGELNLLDIAIQKNFSVLPVDNIDELRQLFHSYFAIYFNKIIHLKKGGITFSEVDYFFSTYNQKYSAFGTEKNEIEEKFKLRQRGGRYVNEWVAFLLGKIKPSIEDILFFNSYKFIMNSSAQPQMVKVTILKYQMFMYLKSGNFFGEIALEQNEKKRNASIRVEENCVVAHLPCEQYLQLIYPNSKKSKMKDLSFLCNNFFFRSLSPIIFEKHFYHNFKKSSLLYTAKVYEQGEKVRELFFLKKGKIKIEFTGSVINMHNMIKLFIDKLEEKKNLFSQSEIAELRHLYLSDPEIVRIKNKDEIFKQDTNKVQTFELFLLNNCEIIGIEELFLDINFITTCTVVTEKVSLITIDVDNLRTIFENEKSVESSFNRLAYKKIITLIKRVNYLKRNMINRALFRMKKEMNRSKSTAEIQSEIGGRVRKSILTDIKSAQLKLTNEKKEFYKLMSDLSANRRTVNVPESNVQKGNSLRFSNSLLNRNKELSSRLVNVSNSSFLKPKQNKKTIIKIKGNYLTADSIENEIQSQNFLINYSSSRNVKKEENNNSGTNHQTQISLVNLSQIQSNEQNEKSLPEIKKIFFAKKFNKVQKNLVKVRSVSQEEINVDISKKMEKNFSNDNMFIAHKIKQYYKAKKLLGYCSIVNLENNKYGKITISKRPTQRNSRSNSKSHTSRGAQVNKV